MLESTKMVDINKNARIDICESIIYGDAINNHITLPKANNINGDVQKWHELTSASRTNSATKLSYPELTPNEKLGQTRPAEKKESHHIKRLKVGGRDVYENGDGIAANRQKYDINRKWWEEGTISQEEQFQDNVKKERHQINSCQTDQIVEHQLQNNQDLEDSNIIEIDMWQKNYQEIHELDVDLERDKGMVQDHITYGECQKNKFMDCRMTSGDDCREFLSSDKDGKFAFICTTCGCHRNFHQCIVFFEDGEQKKLIKTKFEKEERSGNYSTSICDIDQVSHELIDVANSAIALVQNSLRYGERKIQELSINEQNIITKISLENLKHITKVINSTKECLSLLRKPSTFQKDRKSDCPHEGPSSSDASPVITVENQATQSLLTPTLPVPAVGEPPVKSSITIFSCGNHNCGSAPRKPVERPGLKLKRTRTRISLEQREKLNAFAEKAGWTVVGQRKETIDAACQYIGIEPKTLKYWIHNSKQKWKRQPGQTDDMSKL